MRATSMRRLVGGATALMLVGTMLLTTAGSALAADTRFLFMGSDSTYNVANNGILTFSDVTLGGQAAAPVFVKNIDNQTLTHVVITIVRAQDSGATVLDVFGPDSGKCTPSATAFTCDYGNLKAGAKRQFSILATAGSVNSFDVKAQVVFNESNNPNGGNEQIDEATGSLIITTATCDLVKTFFRAGNSSNLGTIDGCALSSGNPQSTRIDTDVTSDSPVLVGEETGSLCAAGLTCFGQVSRADVAINGTYTVIWTIDWQVPSNFNVQKFGILHFPDGSSSPDLNLTAKKNICKTTTSVGCIVSVTLTGTTLEAIVRTKGNGSMRGFN
jgi:hypothetical protein